MKWDSITSKMTKITTEIRSETSRKANLRSEMAKFATFGSRLRNRLYLRKHWSVWRWRNVAWPWWGAASCRSSPRRVLVWWVRNDWKISFGFRCSVRFPRRGTCWVQRTVQDCWLTVLRIARLHFTWDLIATVKKILLMSEWRHESSARNLLLAVQKRILRCQ